MTAPPDYETRVEPVHPLVLAATSETLAPAAEILFVHSADLVWGTPELGLFVARADLGDDLERAVDVASVRARLAGKRLGRTFLPTLLQMLNRLYRDHGETIAAAKDDEESARFAGAVAGLEWATKQRGWLKKHLSKIDVDLFPLIRDAFASGVASAAMKLRRRQLRSFALDEEDFDEVISCLERCGGVCKPVLRIAFSGDEGDPEVSFGGNRGVVRERPRAAHQVEVLRLNPQLASLKHGQEQDLPVFIAEYVNHHAMVETPAFACARYGTKDKAEFDVVIPGLSVGIEAKLYQGPAVVTPEKVRSLAGDLAQQLPAYLEQGFSEVYYVTNLSEEDAPRVLQDALEKCSIDVGVSVTPVAGGIDALCELLDGLVQRINEANDQKFEAIKNKHLNALESREDAESSGSVDGNLGRIPRSEDEN